GGWRRAAPLVSPPLVCHLLAPLPALRVSPVQHYGVFQIGVILLEDVKDFVVISPDDDKEAAQHHGIPERPTRSPHPPAPKAEGEHDDGDGSGGLHGSTVPASGWPRDLGATPVPDCGTGRAAGFSICLRIYATLARAASVSCRVNARSVSVRMLPSDPKE